MGEKFVVTEINRVVMIGKEEYPEQKTSFSGDIRYNELIFHFSGHAMVFFDDLTLETKPNTIRFLPKGRTKRYDVFRYERGECIDVFFQVDRPISPRAFVIDVAQNEKLGTLFKKLFSTWVGKNEGYYFESVSLLYKIFAEMQRSNDVPGQHWMKIRPAVNEIHNSFLQRDFSVEELAAMCGFGESYFQRLFKEKYGVPPRKYIIQLKINHACELLRLERYTVTQIAELCNFSDVYFFSRQFKEYMGITPTQFVKKYRSSK
ncbi:MAG: helix-turn-helix transcriptional regulator [Clostridia bacterium]|nr:helix-turn-helix transcriptional regulator [Clostridia bacterium]